MREIDVDSFAGGGGASVGIEQATGRPVDVAINHDAEALAMHRANHPGTKHYINDIWNIDPAMIVKKHGPIRLAWFSPDCTHHSKAKGRAPIRDAQRRSRDLAWVVVRWAREVKPRIIMLENVEEFSGWGPLRPDGRQCPKRKGQTFDLWVQALRHEGYRVEWKELRACDYGAPTIRKRLFLVARRDGLPISWPEPTHGPGLLPYRTAAECIDWSIPCPSIFLTREEGRRLGCKRPLAEATMRRIARGVWKYVINNSNPFIVPVTHHGSDRINPIDEPLRTVTTAHRGEFALVAPHMMPYRGTKDGGKPRARDIDDPMHTLTCEPSAALVAAFLAQHNTGMTGHSVEDPMSTIVQKGCTQAVVAAHLTRQYSNSVGQECESPAHTVTTRDKTGIVTAHLKRDFGQSIGQECDSPAPTTTADGGGKTGLVTALLSRQFSSNSNGGQADLLEPMTSVLAQGQHHAMVQAFLVKYYGTAIGSAIDEPSPTVTTKARFGLVTVDGLDYRIVDIGMRMLHPRELFTAQGFPSDYVIAPVVNGKPLTKTAQIRMCGNSVCPPMSDAIVRANLRHESSLSRSDRAAS